MRVRGAPAIGVAAAYGIVLAARGARGMSQKAFLGKLRRAGSLLTGARPTAVNLAWAVDLMLKVAQARARRKAGEISRALEGAALRLAEADRAANRAIGRLGAGLMRGRARILTHCNTGALATAGYGTALGVIRTAHRRGKLKRVWVDETRPYMQGARLTAWELKRDGIPFVLITDGMAGHFMQRGAVDAVIVGADRITALGDVANKIGTYQLARLARAHRIPFYVAAPTSTVDLAVREGAAIPIEERPAREVLWIGRRRIAPRGTPVANPAFDVTPRFLVTAIVTEAGVARPPFARTLARLVRRGFARFAGSIG